MSEPLKRPKKDPADIVPDSDMANARRFVRYFGSDLRYVPENGWNYWTGSYWRGGADLTAMEFAKETALMVIEEALTYKDQARKTMFKWARECQSLGHLRATLSLARSDDELRIPITDFDSDPWLFNCQNGMINLKNGKLLPHDPLKYCTRISPAIYGYALTPDSLWLNFLNDITAGNQEMQGYLQRIAGYSLTGSIAEKCFFFCFGGGNNGKSVFIEVLHELLGNYSLALNTQTLVKQRFSSGIPNDVARLHGPRLATVSETSKGEEWNDKLLKDLTGGDIITARFLKKEFFDFRSQCKLIIRGNNKPNINDHSAAFIERLHLIPFEVEIGPEKKDKDLREKIVRRELSGILTWAVEGCLEWQKIGLAPPDAVARAVDEYRKETDVIGVFMEERTERDSWNVLDVKASTLYNAYREWCSESGFRAVNATAFGLDLKSKNYPKVRKGNGNYYTSLILKSCENEGENDDAL